MATSDISRKHTPGPMIAAAPEMYDLLAEINQTFYVDGTSKALKAVMAKTKPLLNKARGRT